MRRSLNAIASSLRWSVGGIRDCAEVVRERADGETNGRPGDGQSADVVRKRREEKRRDERRREESKDKEMQEYILLGSVHACLMEVVCYHPCEAVAVLRAGRKRPERHVERAPAKL